MHLFCHTINPIVNYDREILGIFSATSVAHKKNNILEKVYSKDTTKKSLTKVMK